MEQPGEGAADRDRWLSTVAIRPRQRQRVVGDPELTQHRGGVEVDALADQPVRLEYEHREAAALELAPGRRQPAEGAQCVP